MSLVNDRFVIQLSLSGKNSGVEYFYIIKSLWIQRVMKMKKIVFNPIGTFVIGAILGVISRLLDIYTTNLGNVFSELSIWILFGVIISIYSDTKKKAMLNIFPFCMGMLITYYITAVISKGVYSKTYIIGWTAFAFISPLLAYFTCMTKENGVIPKIIAVGIILVSVFSSIVLFDKLRVYDFIIDGVLIYLLFIRKKK